jgi:hypothetical protein
MASLLAYATQTLFVSAYPLDRGTLQLAESIDLLANFVKISSSLLLSIGKFKSFLASSGL